MSLFGELAKPPVDLRTLAYAKSYAQRNTPVGVIAPDGVTKLWIRLNSAGNLVIDPLKYPRPDFTSWTRVDILNNTQYKINNGTTQSYGTTLTLPNNTTDYVVYLSSTNTLGKINGINIASGRNVAVIGGEIDFSNKLTPPYGFNNYNQSTRRGLQLLNFTGSVWVEGTWIHGNQLGDGIWFNPSSPADRTFTWQNSLIEGCAAEDLQAQDDGIHPDVIQFNDKANSVYAGLTFRSYQTIGRTAYQGFTTNDNFPQMEFERTHIDMQSVLNWDGSKVSGYALGIFDSGTQGTHLVVGPEVEVRQDPSSYVAPVYPEHVAGWQQMNVSQALTDPAWFAALPSAPGKGYIPPQPIAVGAGDLAAHIAATTGVHGIPNTAQLPLTVNHGSTASTARPAWPGIVIWSGTVQPANAVSGDIIVVS